MRAGLLAKERSLYPLAIAAAFVLLTGCTANVAVRPFDTRPLIKKPNMRKRGQASF